MTSADTSIPDSAAVRLVARGDIAMTLHSPAPSQVVHHEEEGTTEHCFTLPAIPSDASHDCHMTVSLPSLQCVPTTPSQNLFDQLPAWKKEVSESKMVQCLVDLALLHAADGGVL